MINEAKYIITADNNVIVFGMAKKHSEFKHFNPMSAGFVRISLSEDKIVCRCYGESSSLNLKSNPEKDSEMVKRQLGIIQ